MPSRTSSTDRSAQELREAFGQLLRAHRKRAKMSQEALALEAGYDRTYIGQLELGDKSASIVAIFRLAEALNVSPAKLMKKVERDLTVRGIGTLR